MTTDVIMPKLGLTMKDGTVVNWLKKEGDRVEKGEPILEVETEKISCVVEAPASGVLLRIAATKGSIVPVAGLLAVIGELGEEVSLIQKRISETEPPEKVTQTEKVEKPNAAVVSKEAVKISPLAKKIAEERKVDFTRIKGTGPGGRIVKEDVLKAIGEGETVGPQVPAVSKEGVDIIEVIPMTGTRRTIAERLSHSYHSAVHATVITEVDMTQVARFRKSFLGHVTEKTGASPTYTCILAKGVALALREHRTVNSTLEEDGIKLLKNINVGVAVDVEGGLMVPVIRDADHKSLFEIALILGKLVEKARNRTLSMEEVSAGTFTMTNLGMLGPHTFVPIINPPQTAILGVGTIEDKPAVINGKIEARPKMNLSLVFDHRVIDGAEAARFLQTLKRVLENPSKLIS